MSLEQPGVLCEDVRVIYIQFSFSANQVVPTPLRKLPDETPEKHESRKSAAWQSKQFLDHLDRTTARGFLSDLEKAGYTLVDAVCQRRLGGQKGKWYNMVRYTFAHKTAERESKPEFERIRDRARISLVRLLTDAYWRVRGYHNLTGEGHSIEGEWLSLNFEHRMPLTTGDGRPVTEWRKDEAGERIGNAPLPIQPRHALQVWGRQVITLEYRAKELQSA